MGFVVYFSKLFRKFVANHELHSRTQAECDLITGDRMRQPRNNFNPRTQAECDSLGCLKSTTLPYFNPRTQAECDVARKKVLYSILSISIHALKQSATSPLFRFYLSYAHFNPRTQAECDFLVRIMSLSLAHHFNPRTQAECDLLINLWNGVVVFISIHALKQSATFPLLELCRS